MSKGLKSKGCIYTMDLFVRITVDYERVKDFLQRLSDDADKLIVYQHDASRVHIHFYIVNVRIKPDAIKTRFKKFMGINEWPRTDWSFESATDDGCIRYMSKGIFDPVYNKGFDLDRIAELKSSWVDKGKVKQTKDTITQYVMSMEVYELVKEWSKKPFGVIPTQEIYRQCIIFSIQVCHKYRKGFDEFSLRKIAQPAYVKFEHCGEQFVNKCVEKFFL